MSNNNKNKKVNVSFDIDSDNDQEVLKRTKPKWLEGKTSDQYRTDMARGRAVSNLTATFKKIPKKLEYILFEDYKNNFFEYYETALFYDLTIGAVSDDDILPEWTNKKDLDQFGITRQRFYDDKNNKNRKNYEIALIEINKDDKFKLVQDQFDIFQDEVMPKVFDYPTKSGNRKLNKMVKAMKLFSDSNQNLEGYDYLKKRLGSYIKEIYPQVNLNF